MLIKLVDKQKIVLMVVRDGKSQRGVERETGINRKTIRKYIREYEEDRIELLGCDGTKENARELTESIVKRPTYDSSNRKKRKVTDELLAAIRGYIDENERRRERGQRKQQRKKIDIYEALVKDGFDISYPTVCNTIRALENKGAEAFIRAEYELGDVCEFDWGEVKLEIAGQLRILQMAAFTSAKGNYRHAILFMKQDTSCFLESHASFFEHIAGVYRTLVYDNMKVVVKKFVGTEKEPTEALLNLSMYYGFQFRLCNIGRGNEKGHVEKSVEYVRRKAFSAKDSFSSVQEANEYLAQVCYELNGRPQSSNANQIALEVLEKERPYLLPKVPMYDAAKIAELRVSKYSTVTVNSCYYSVPEQYVGKMIFTKIYSDQIICYHDGTLVASHVRKFGHSEWSIQLEHYLGTFKKKPGALASSVALHQADPKLRQIYTKYYITKERDFIDLIHFISEMGLESVEQAIATLNQISPLEVTTEKIKAICNRSLEPDSRHAYIGYKTDITTYSLEMLKSFGRLMPPANESFEKGVKII